MALQSINPCDGGILETIARHDETDVARAVAAAAAVAGPWAARPVAERAAFLSAVAERLRARREELARVITREMGKLIGEAEAEIDKCALVCDYYAEHAERFLADVPVDSDAGRSLVVFQPLGLVLAVMPWNFPFWQVFRCAAPALAAGNTVLLKHASNVPRCALTIAEVFAEAGLPVGVFATLLIDAARAEALVADPRIRAVSLTGSEAAGRRVARSAGEHLKKTVLELGGSDAFVVLEDADLDAVVESAVRGRFINAGQSCIAAKRFIVVAARADDVVARLRPAIEALRPGDPLDPATTLAPLARADLREQLDEQVRASLRAGARCLAGGRPLEGPGWFYAATLLDRVAPGMPAYEDELFGPVAAVIRAADEAEALRIANDSRYGLGGSVWTADPRRGEAFARRMACGAAFVNGIVKSDPRLPFGGIKDSGYGRELGELGIREFVNAKTLWVG
ncbi:NAD-dependent succinate-semialdehyde dehydrogenase [Thiococcus pfennigii]|uniref:NAD-dependent succinate-semialdehyde dehydrogenase n=1 Tax=Thiococcus pfennigii TaxID=1057 RepID=UPI0019032253|nr:NAD-dependent succinate-semialdehyde dehydrogenase [Thiococcus pfennigii]MBK1701358.1 succinate-semialdehyde dehydrogenase [Thiococcus pfennigii]MBK1730542.1 succinate-semialdehyde dehydrogenase [Thiococcus pfennigii]